MGSVVAGNNSATNHVKTWFGSANRCIEFIFLSDRFVSNDQFLILSGHVQQLHLTPFETSVGASIYAGFKTQMGTDGHGFDALKKANADLQAKFKVTGFPTFVALNPDGQEIGRQVGYLDGGPQAFAGELEKFRER